MSLIPSSSGTEVAALGIGSFAPALLFGSSFLGGLSQYRAAQENAKIAEDNAAAARLRGYFAERGLKLEQNALLSTIRNRAAGAGLDVSQGSPLDVYLHAARETEMDIVNARMTTDQEFRSALNTAGRIRSAGRGELFGSALSGFGRVLSYMNQKKGYSFGG